MTAMTTSSSAADANDGRGFPLRTYTSKDPLNATSAPKAKCPLGTQSEHAIPTMFQHSMKGRKKIRFSAKNFVQHFHDKRSLEDDYEVQELVGEGAFGEVFRCVHRGTGSVRAVKVMPRSRSEVENEEVRNEFRVVKELDHPNLIKQYNMYESKDKFQIVTDIYRGGEMFDVLDEEGNLSERDAASLMNHLLSCMNYCHQQGIVHRDLKPENILLSDSRLWEDIKIIDFGLAKLRAKDDKTPLTEMVGSPYYVAPQVLEGEYTNKCDVWSCGVIAYLALSGECPFYGATMEQVQENVLIGRFEFEGDIWNDVSESAKDFIRKLLEYDEKDRPSCEEALQHEWLSMERDASKSAVLNSARRRSTMKEALAGMQTFEAYSHLKQATCALLSSQILPQEARKEIDNMFRILDVDCSGQLTKDEVQKGFAEFYNQSLTDEEVEELFQKVNFSGSGEIEYSEFVCACLLQTDFIDETMLKAAFAEFDLDGSGTISVDELKELFTARSAGAGGNVDEAMINAIIQQVDTNGDGEIDFDEFKTMMVLTATEPPMEVLQMWSDTREEDTHPASDSDDSEHSFSGHAAPTKKKSVTLAGSTHTATTSPFDDSTRSFFLDEAEPLTVVSEEKEEEENHSKSTRRASRKSSIHEKPKVEDDLPDLIPAPKKKQLPRMQLMQGGELPALFSESMKFFESATDLSTRSISIEKRSSIKKEEIVSGGNVGKRMSLFEKKEQDGSSRDLSSGSLSSRRSSNSRVSIKVNEKNPDASSEKRSSIKKEEIVSGAVGKRMSLFEKKEQDVSSRDLSRGSQSSRRSSNSRASIKVNEKPDVGHISSPKRSSIKKEEIVSGAVGNRKSLFEKKKTGLDSSSHHIPTGSSSSRRSSNSRASIKLNQKPDVAHLSSPQRSSIKKGEITSGSVGSRMSIFEKPGMDDSSSSKHILKSLSEKRNSSRRSEVASVSVGNRMSIFEKPGMDDSSSSKHILKSLSDKRNSSRRSEVASVSVGNRMSIFEKNISNSNRKTAPWLCQ